MNFPSFESLTGQVVKISRSDRWQVYQRLQELEIPCCCSDDGLLRVEVENVLMALQVRSVVQQITGSRPELTRWLETCWHTSF